MSRGGLPPPAAPPGRGRGLGRGAGRGDPREGPRRGGGLSRDDERPGWTLRALEAQDVDGVCRLDARHTGVEKPGYWRRVFADYLEGDESRGSIGLAADEGDSLVGYLLGEVRAFEFGAEPCGWIFAIGVAPERARSGLASRMLAEAIERFRSKGLSTVRTMVEKTDIPVHSFFRANGFIGGSYHQLELPLEQNDD